jgi:hypothetical protein
MELDNIKTLPPPPGVIGSLRAGFDAIASNLTVILLPLALDLFLWLGPRLRVDQLFEVTFDEILSLIEVVGVTSESIKNWQEISALLLEQTQQFNLFSAIRTFPIGIFSLMSAAMPKQTPWGAPSAIYVNSDVAFLGWIVLLTLFGWLCGSLFFHWVSLVVEDPSPPAEKRIGQPVLQTMLLSIMYFILVIMLGTPVLVMLYVMLVINPLLAQALLLILALLSMWLIVPVFFIPHGIFMHRQNAFASIYTSLRMARFTLPTSSLFVLSVLLIAFGLNYVWKIPTSDSWMTLIGLIGHAFITTSLLAASFIYYRDMQVWLQTVFEKLKANLPAQQA